jgi:hypothetical protein
MARRTSVGAAAEDALHPQKSHEKSAATSRTQIIVFIDILCFSEKLTGVLFWQDTVHHLTQAYASWRRNMRAEDKMPNKRTILTFAGAKICAGFSPLAD